MNDSIPSRKADHITLCATEDVSFRAQTNLLEGVRLVHDALPDLSLSDIDLAVTLFGVRLRAPILIAAMTGGTDDAGRINRELAAIAEARGYGFGLGSQRAMFVRPDAAHTYDVRKVAPSTLILGNVGIVQARSMTSAELRGLADQVGANALCIHLNPAMELVQSDGDRDFRDGLKTIERAVREVGIPIVVKETGCGLSRNVGARLVESGVRHVDVSGAGGTSWVGVETKRAEARGQADAASLGELFWDWGIPTAASVAMMKPLGLETIIATGGVASGLDVARAITLGAHAAGLARPVLRALESGGRGAAEAFLDRVERELRTAMLLTGSRDVAALQKAQTIIGPELARWLA